MLFFDTKPDIDYNLDYSRIVTDLNELERAGDEQEWRTRVASFCLEDLFFLLYFVLDVKVINQWWVVDRIREVGADSDEHLDIWSRDTFKSTIITYGLTIQDILRDSNIRVAILSEIKSLAKKLGGRIKTTLESNDLLKALFPGVLWENPESQSSKWSIDHGLVVKRTKSFFESTLDFYGITESLPTGVHYDILAFDDIVTWDNTRTPDRINKVKDGFRHSHNLRDTKTGRERVVGTIYKHNDLICDLRDSGQYKVRINRADLLPSLWTEDEIADKYRKMGRWVFATQISLDPRKEEEEGFEMSWFRTYLKSPVCNNYILVDPAGEKKEGRSFTCMWVVGVAADGRFYVRDCVKDRLNLGERWIWLRDLATKWNVLGVGYEKYSMQGDLDYVELKQKEENVWFHIEPVGGSLSKDDRIKRLVPYFENGYIFFPMSLDYKDIKGARHDLVEEFLEQEYKFFPACTYKDMLDSLSRIVDVDMVKPHRPTTSQVKEFTYDPYSTETTGSWMAIV